MASNGRRFFVGGNWKMNYSKAILDKVNEALGKTAGVEGRRRVVVFSRLFKILEREYFS